MDAPQPSTPSTVVCCGASAEVTADSQAHHALCRRGCMSRAAQQSCGMLGCLAVGEAGGQTQLPRTPSGCLDRQPAWLPAQHPTLIAARMHTAHANTAQLEEESMLTYPLSCRQQQQHAHRVALCQATFHCVSRRQPQMPFKVWPTSKPPPLPPPPPPTHTHTRPRTQTNTPGQVWTDSFELSELLHTQLLTLTTT